MFQILGLWLPNERSKVFRWIFNVVLTAMIPKNILQKVKVIISDEDQQECSEID